VNFRNRIGFVFGRGVGSAALGKGLAGIAFVASVSLVSGCGQDGGGSPAGPPAVVVERPLLVMVQIPAGSFLMGSPEGVGTANERPQRKVTIGQPFLMGRTEVTREQYLEVLGRGDERGPTLPMGGTTWYDAIEFCNELSKREGLEPAYDLEVLERDPQDSVKRARVARNGGNGYRLPSESEWEYACRAGSGEAWSFGDDADALYEHGWFQGHGNASPQPVGSLTPNRWGLADMHGNVWEWVEDGFESGYAGAPADTSVWKDSGFGGRVLRGGGYLANADYCRSAYRNRGIPGLKGGAFGFRVVLEAVEASPATPEAGADEASAAPSAASDASESGG
jgi:formylglycine-generating enzyme required for sulfatase activity